MNRSLKLVLAALAFLTFADSALARGGSARNSYGYQRRLQESRGFVTTHSNGYPERGPLYYYRHRNWR